MAIKVGFDYISKKRLVNFKRYAKKVALIDDTIRHKTGLGNDYLGWVDYPTRVDTTVLEKIDAKAKEFIENYEVLVVCGIGGSYLGARAAIEAINGLYPTNKMKIIFLGQTLDSNYISSALDYLKDKTFGICVISKSGTTTETSVSFRILKNLLIKKIGKAKANKAIVAVTDKTKGALRVEADKEGYTSFVLPNDIGGRFSVMTPVGLFPIACAGINIFDLIQGMKDAQKEYDNPDVLTNAAYQYALQRNHLYNMGYRVEMQASYEPQLRMLSEWWKQLFDESEGKDDKAVLTVATTFTTDLHSLGQFIQQGSKVLYETILFVKEPKADIEVPTDKEDLDGLNYLAGKKVSYINDKAYMGTLKAHAIDGNVPNITITVDHLNTYDLGYLFFFFMKACAMSAYLLGVNPFNQPGVEIYKKNMFHLLGKTGY